MHCAFLVNVYRVRPAPRLSPCRVLASAPCPPLYVLVPSEPTERHRNDGRRPGKERKGLWCTARSEPVGQQGVCWFIRQEWPLLSSVALSPWVSSHSLFPLSGWLHRICFWSRTVKSMKFPKVVCISGEQRENWIFLSFFVVVVFLNSGGYRGIDSCYLKSDIYNLISFGFLRTSFWNSSLSWKAYQRFKWQRPPTPQKTKTAWFCRCVCFRRTAEHL